MFLLGNGVERKGGVSLGLNISSLTSLSEQFRGLVLVWLSCGGLIRAKELGWMDSREDIANLLGAKDSVALAGQVGS